MSFETISPPILYSIYRMQGEEYLVVFSSEDRIRLEAVRRQDTRNYSLERFSKLLRSGELILVRDVAMPVFIAAAENLTEKQKQRFDRRRLYVEAVMVETNGNLSRTHYKAMIAKVAQALGDETVPSYSTIARWRNLYLDGNKSNRSLLDKHAFIKKRADRLDKSVERIISMVISDVLLKPEQVCEQYVYRLIVAKIHEHNQILDQENPLRPPSLNSVRVRIDRMDVMFKIERRHGKYEARKRNQHGGKILVGNYIGERVEMDSQIVDVFVWDPKHCVALRPRLTLVLDVASRCVLGWDLSLNNISAAKSMAALRDAMTQDDFCETKAIPHRLYVDNGCEFVNQALTVSCDLLGITPVYCSPKSPNQKPHVERIFKTFNDGFFHNIPGTTKSNPAQRGDYPSEDEANLRIEDLRFEFRRYVHEVYHLTEHSSLNKAPLDKWRELAKNNQPRTLAASESKHHFFIPKEVTINHGRVRAFNIEWTSPGLPTIQEKLSRQRIKKKVRLMIDPDRIGTAYVLDPSNPLSPQAVRCIEPEIYHDWSLRQWKWVREQDRAEAKNSSLQDPLRLSRSLLSIQDGLTQAAKNNKGKGKRKRAVQQLSSEIRTEADDLSAPMKGIVAIAAVSKRTALDTSLTNGPVSSTPNKSVAEPSLKLNESKFVHGADGLSQIDTFATLIPAEPTPGLSLTSGEPMVDPLDDLPDFSSSVLIRKKYD